MGMQSEIYLACGNRGAFCRDLSFAIRVGTRNLFICEDSDRLCDLYLAPEQGANFAPWFLH